MGATERIIERLVPEWISHQQQKSKDYNSSKGLGLPAGFENADVLGIPGQFAEIWRKIWKLKKGMWDGEALVGESVREILLDLIGHAFLAIEMIDRKTGEDWSAKRKAEKSLVEGVTKAMAPLLGGFAEVGMPDLRKEVGAMEAGRLALLGDTSYLDSMGLRIDTLQGYCTRACGEPGESKRHTFAKGCGYRVVNVSAVTG